MEDMLDVVRETPGGEGGGDGGAAMGGIVAEGGIGLSGIKLPGSVSAGLSAPFSGSGVLDCTDVDWLTFLKVSLAFLYACISARHAPDIDRIADRKKMARDWKEKECDDDAR